MNREYFIPLVKVIFQIKVQNKLIFLKMNFSNILFVKVSLYVRQLTLGLSARRQRAMQLEH